MHSHLVVMTFEQEEEATRVYDALQRMRGRLLLGLEHAAAVTKDSRGRLAVYRRTELSRAGKDRGADLVGSAISLLFGDPPDDVVQALVKEGFDDRFREQVAGAVGNNSSALVLLIARDSDADRGRVLGTLTLFKGTVFETTLPPRVEAALAAAMVEGWEA
jgi:uncharacterized membrane protein